MSKLLSVIIPSHNPQPWLIDAIRSVFDQEGIVRQQIEIILVNDASTKVAVYEQLTELPEAEHIRLINLKSNQGPSAARNEGLKVASGKFIAFLDDDDLWPKDKWKCQSAAFASNESLEIVSGQIQYFTDGAATMPDINFHEDDDKLYHVHLGACLMRADCLEQKGLFFDEDLRLSEDWDWWLKVKEKGINHLILDVPTLLYRVHEQNTSVNLPFSQLGLLAVLKRSLDRRRADQSAQALAPHLGAQKDEEVTVIIPLYNGEKFIARTLNSVKRQTYPIREIIVVDDGSTDAGAAVVAEKFPEVKLIRQTNLGVAKARNVGWKESKTAWVAFLDQDDEWVETKTERQMAIIRQNRNHDLIFCHQQFVSIDGDLPVFYKAELRKAHASFAPSSWLVRKSTLESLNGFNEQMRYTSDTDFIQRYRASNQQAASCDEMLLVKHVTGENESLAVRAMTKEILSVLHKNRKQISYAS